MSKPSLAELAALVDAGTKLDEKLVNIDKDVRQEKPIDTSAAKALAVKLLGNITETKQMVNKMKPLIA